MRPPSGIPPTNAFPQPGEVGRTVPRELTADLPAARLDGAGQETGRLRLAERAAQLVEDVPVHERPVLERGVQLGSQALGIGHAQARSTM
jgi:hypothetical protein